MLKVSYMKIWREKKLIKQNKTKKWNNQTNEWMMIISNKCQKSNKWKKKIFTAKWHWKVWIVFHRWLLMMGEQEFCFFQKSDKIFISYDDDDDD